MSGEVVTTKSFQERIFDRIREQIGELMTDEDLSKLVEAAVQKAFFEPRVKTSGWSTSTEPPLIVEIVEKLLRERVKDETANWLVKHQDDVTKIVQEALGRGFTAAVQSYIDSRMAGPMNTFAEQLRQSGLIR